MPAARVAPVGTPGLDRPGDGCSNPLRKPGAPVVDDDSMFAPREADDGPWKLSEEERMLVLLRDELYDGSWDEFVRDLKDRLAARPHLFDITPASPRLRETIRHHLRLIGRLREYEARTGFDLARGLDDPAPPAAPPRS